MNSAIYIIKNIVNNKVYIGQTQDIQYRFRKHKEALRGNRHANKHLQNSWNKHGELCFEFIVSQICPVEQLTWQEQTTFNYFKQFLDTFNKGEFTDCPTRGRKFVCSEETKKKLSLSKMGDKNPMKRKGVRDRMAASHKGKKLSEQHKIKIKQSSHKIRPERFVRIERIDLLTGEVKIYQSIQSTKMDGFEPGTVSKCLANKCFKHKGYGWCYLDKGDS